MKTILRNKSDYEALRKHYLNIKNRGSDVSTYDLHILEPEQYPCIAVTKINDNARGQDFITGEYVYGYDWKDVNPVA
jgi:hypothetical protein